MKNTNNGSIEISYGKLTVLSGEDERLPLSGLDDNSHIHGELSIEIGGRSVPYMGYFGADDVCFSTWIDELDNVAKTFESGEIGSYIFDEGEQGQPAYLFEKDGARCFLSIVDSAITKQQGDDEWQRVDFWSDDFLTQYKNFRTSFIDELKNAAPETYEKWWKTFVRQS